MNTFEETKKHIDNIRDESIEEIRKSGYSKRIYKDCEQWLYENHEAVKLLDFLYTKEEMETLKHKFFLAENVMYNVLLHKD
jgi:ribosome recycling factor